MQLEPGMELVDGRYLLESRLGEGGFGEVWRAHDQLGQRAVALKLLHREHSSRPRILERFEREIHLGVWLGHEGVPRVTDAGRDAISGRHFFAMEFVEGRPLGAVDLALPQLVEALIALLDVLAVAHARGIVHRDLKPENVLVVSDAGRIGVRLLDFGIVRVGGSARAALEIGDHQEEERTLGSVFWMSPEQAGGDAASVGPASDLYSLGIMLFELLSGAVPFKGTLANVIYAHIAGAVPPLVPRTELGAVPHALHELVADLLVKRYVERPEFAADVRRRLTTVRALLGPAPPFVFESDADVAPTGAPEDATIVTGEPVDQTLATLAFGATQVSGDAPVLGDATTDTPSARTSRHRSLLRLVDPPLAGRRQPRAALESLARAVCDGVSAGALALVTGPSGMGTSRLARWLAESVHADGRMRVLTIDLGTRLRLTAALQAALLEYLRNPRLEREPLEARVVEVLGLDGEDLDALCDLLLSGAELHGTRTSSPIPPPISMRALAAASIRPSPRPLLLWIDGVGRESPAMVAYWASMLVERAVALGATMLVVWSLDPDQNAEDRDRLQAVFGAADHARVIELGPLEADAQRDLLRALVPTLTDDAVEAICADAQGSPLFLREMLLDLVESCALVQTAAGYTLADRARRSARLEDALRARVERLLQSHPDDGRRVLEVLALLGSGWTSRQLGQVFGRLGVAPFDLMSSGLLAWQANAGKRRLAFANAQLHAMLHSDAVASETRRASRDVALAVRFDAVLDAMGVSDWERARHELEAAWELLDDVGTHERADVRLQIIDLRARIASRQRERDALAEHARVLSTRARRIDGARGAHWRAIAEMWEGFAHILADDFDAAAGAYANALMASEAGSSPEARARVLHRMGQHARGRGHDHTAHSRLVDARAAFAEALAVTPATSPWFRLLSLCEAHAAKDLGEVLSSLGREAEATRALDASLAGFQKHGDPAFEARLHMALARLWRRHIDRGSRHPTHFEVIESHLGEAADLLDSLDDLLGQAMLVHEAARLALARDELDKARRMLEEAGRLFGAAGHRSGMAVCANSCGEICREQGRLGEAERHYRSSVELARESGNALHIGIALFNLAAVMRARGELETACAQLEEALTTFGMHAPLACRAPAAILLAEVDTALGHWGAARRQLSLIAGELLGQRLPDRDAHAALLRVRSVAAEATDIDLVQLVDTLLPSVSAT